METLLMVGEVAKFLGMHNASVRHAADGGSLPCKWQTDTYGRQVRTFQLEDVIAYREMRKERLTKRLLSLSGDSLDSQAAA